VLIPGVVTSGNDVVIGTSTTAFPIHGGRGNEGRLTYNNAFVTGAAWPRPNTILTPRFFRITVETGS
jgi:hypothetical protein